MNKQIIKIVNISKSFGIKIILKDISLSILSNDRIGFIGENGSGKTTLCKILIGQEQPDVGIVHIDPGIEIGYLPQEVKEFSKDDTVQKYFERYLGSIDLIKNEMIDLEKKMANNFSDEILKRYGELQEIWEKKQAWDLDHRIERVKQGIGIEYIKQDRLLSSLSGGEKTRVALAALLIFSPDFLILDEPTNHLDFSTLKWLEEYLTDFKKAVMIISHDREFLNKTINKIFEISLYTHEISVFYGNYDQYLLAAEKDFEKHEREYENYLQEMNDLKFAIKQKNYMTKKPKGPADSFKAAWELWGGRAEKSKSSQLKDLKLRLKRLEEKPVLKPTKSALKGFRFYDADLASDIPIKMKNLSKSFGSKIILSEINKEILKGDRIVIVGENGSGKTTFLNLITQTEKPTEGNIEIAPSSKIGYLDQMQKSLNLENTVLEEYSTCKIADESVLREDLHKLGLFTSEEVFLKVRDLSLGQKQKLLLAKIIAVKPNILILDEPTNHLDLLALEELEKSLENFKGVIVAVSHDRRFINNIATDVWHLKNTKLLSENQNEVSEKEKILSDR
ncbi:MAG: ABC-F family ATP-binding cassette domain-containing protein [Parachlamydiales bacterium]|jgi:macrolide transport system ATP-binding/permease protein